jgi:hypothetical protein
MVHEANIKSTLDRIGCNASLFCVLTEGKISETRLSRALRGIQPLGGPEIEILSKLLAELTALVQDAEPYVLSFRNPERIKALLEQRRSGLRLILVPLGPPHLIEEFEKAKSS